MPSSYPRRKNRVSLHPVSLPSSQLAPEEDQEAQRLQMEADDAAIVAAENKRSQEDEDYTPSQHSVQSSQSTDADEDECMPSNQQNGSDGSETGGEDEPSARVGESQPDATTSQETADLHKQRLTQVRRVMTLDECNSPSRKALITKVLSIAWGVDESAVERMARGPVRRTEG